MVTNQQVKVFYQGLRDVKCPLTDELVMAGYRQEALGYIAIAEAAEIINPSQWWHLMNYLLIKEEQHQENEAFCNRIICGELIFWMAEVSEAVSKEKLVHMKEQILRSGDLKNRKKWNYEIKSLCWDAIMNRIEQENVYFDN